MAKGKAPSEIKDIDEGRAANAWSNGEQPIGGPFAHKTPPGKGRRVSKLVIEIAANEDDVLKEHNPHVPHTAEEIAQDAIRCAQAGASVYHFHNKDDLTSKNVFDDPDLFLRTASLIRKESDMIFCPSYSFDPRLPLRPQLQYMKEFASDPALKPEIMGVVPIHEAGISSHYDPKEKKFYNPKTQTMEFLAFLRELGIKPIICCFEVGHIREVMAYLDYGLLEEPLTIKVFMSDVGLYGIPPTTHGMTMLDALLDPRYDWQVLFSVYGPYDSSSRNVVHPIAVANGHHLRSGIGDLNRNGFFIIRDLEGREKTVSNVDLVNEAVGWARAAGREVANAQEARRIFGIGEKRGQDAPKAPIFQRVGRYSA